MIVRVPQRLLVFLVFCVAWKLLFSALPDAWVSVLFCRVPAEIAAFYYGAALHPTDLSFTAHGVSLAVTRACAATDFFALLVSALAIARRKFGPRALRGFLVPGTAWAVTLIVNSLRIIALVPADAAFPKEQAPIVHLLVGVAFFLPTFAFIWYHTQSGGKTNERLD